MPMSLLAAALQGLCWVILLAGPTQILLANQADILSASEDAESTVDQAETPSAESIVSDRDQDSTVAEDTNGEVDSVGTGELNSASESTDLGTPDAGATDSDAESSEDPDTGLEFDEPIPADANDSDAARTETGTEAASPAAESLAEQVDVEEFGPKSESESPNRWWNFQTLTLVGVVLAILGIASIVARYLTRQSVESVNPALVRRFRQRLNAWWFMCAILAFGLLLSSVGTVVLFGFVSFWALREFITMAPTRRGDHRALFWALIVFTPLQYLLIGLESAGWTWWRSGEPVDFYGLYSIVIPVYASLYIPARIAISGDHKRFLERSAQITFGLLICVYSLSYAPALVNLGLTDSQGNAWAGSPAGLLFYFVLMSQLSDILQWTWGHWVGQKFIAEEVSSGRTWEGFVGGTLSTGLLGAALYWVTPFTFYESALMSMAISVMGMYGGMTMSAIKRDRGVNDYGSLVLGHAGVLDRIDTICFAAPVFYHLTRFFFTS